MTLDCDTRHKHRLVTPDVLQDKFKYVMLLGQNPEDEQNQLHVDVVYISFGEQSIVAQ